MLKEKDIVSVRLTTGGDLDNVVIPVNLNKDSFNYIKLRCIVPKTENSKDNAIVKVYGSSIDVSGKIVWTTETYNLPFKEKIYKQCLDYEVYEADFPAEFCSKNGDLTLTFTYCTVADDGSITSLLPSANLNLYIGFVGGKGFNPNSFKVSNYELTAAKVNELAKTKVDKVESEEGIVLITDGEGGMKPSTLPIKEYEDQKEYIDKLNQQQAENLDLHKEDKDNPHNVTVEQLGLENVDNTADVDKPISIAQQEALNFKVNYTDIVDNSDSGETQKALSANQGKVLKSLAGNKLSLSVDPKTFVMTINLLNSADEILSTGHVDLPLETMVVSATYNNGILTLTLQNGQTLDVNISSLISGLVPNTRKVNGKPLSADIIIDIPTKLSQLGEDDTHKTVTTAEKTSWNNKVDKETGKRLSANDLTNELKSSIETNTLNRHNHANKSVLDRITSIDDKLSTTSENPVQNKIINQYIKGLEVGQETLGRVVGEALDLKVDKETGKGLSSNDYTTAEKNKLAGLSNYDDTEIKTSISTKANNLDLTEEINARKTADADLQSQINTKANASDIPTKESDLKADRGYLTSFIETDPTVPQWAKSETKPTYDYSEIKNTPIIPEGAKLYNTTGSNEDGAMTQKATSQYLPLPNQCNAFAIQSYFNFNGNQALGPDYIDMALCSKGATLNIGEKILLLATIYSEDDPKYLSENIYISTVTAKNSSTYTVSPSIVSINGMIGVSVPRQFAFLSEVTKVDSEYSTTSENPIQNKVIDQSIKDLQRQLNLKVSNGGSNAGYTTYLNNNGSSIEFILGQGMTRVAEILIDSTGISINTTGSIKLNGGVISYDSATDTFII